ncbi:hypothetical protein CKI55_RS22580 [Vibrio parahaemolyticus]|nr:hypothetical protein [Vibrio parahaemolyticus]
MSLVKDYSSSYTYEGFDSESGEIILRQYYIFDDGDQLIFQNQYCLMNNYLMSYQSEQLDLNKIKLRVNTILDGIRDKHKLVVKPNFFATWLNESEKLELVVESKFEALEISGALLTDENAVLPEMISLYIGVGGKP